MDRAVVDDSTQITGLVADQQVTASHSKDNKRYFIVAGVRPGLATRFQPKAIPQGVTIDECSDRHQKATVTVELPINGQDVNVKALLPGQYELECTFFTAGREDGGRGITDLALTVE